MPSEAVPVRPVGFPITITRSPSTLPVDCPRARNGTSVARNFNIARSTPGGWAATFSKMNVAALGWKAYPARARGRRLCAYPGKSEPAERHTLRQLDDRWTGEGARVAIRMVNRGYSNPV